MTVRMHRSDRGSIALELVAIVTVLLPPVLWGALAAAQAASAATATSAAVAAAARAFATAPSVEVGQARARTVASHVFADHGWGDDVPPVLISCGGAPCLEPGSVVIASARWRAPLRAIPVAQVSVPVAATERVPVDDFRADP